MKKDYKSIACPECKSTSVDVKTTYKNKHTKDVIYGGEDAVEYYQERVMKCHCPSCDKDYSVSQGKEIYTVLKEPLPQTVSRDIQLLAIYDSSFDNDFKIVKASTYNGSSITMALVENDEYPVILPEQQDVSDLPKVKKILFNTWMDRYR